MIVMTLLVRDEADIVAATIEHHLAVGVDLIIATDNNSVDGTDAILAAYQAAGVLELHRQADRALRQVQWVTGMARRAAVTFGAQWVINADADEFLWPAENLRELFESLQAAAIVVERDNLIEDPVAAGPWPSRLILRDSLCAHWRDENATLQNGTFTRTYHARKLSPDQMEDQLTSGVLVRDTRLRDRLAALTPTAVLPAELHKVTNEASRI